MTLPANLAIQRAYESINESTSVNEFVEDDRIEGIKSEMASHGYEYNDMDSDPERGYIKFDSNSSSSFFPLSFKSWDEAEDWVNNVEFDESAETNEDYGVEYGNGTVYVYNIDWGSNKSDDLPDDDTINDVDFQMGEDRLKNFLNDYFKSNYGVVPDSYNWEVTEWEEFSRNPADKELGVPTTADMKRKEPIVEGDDVKPTVDYTKSDVHDANNQTPNSDGVIVPTAYESFEQALECMTKSINESGESEEVKSSALGVLNQLKGSVKDEGDVKAFLDKYGDKIAELERSKSVSPKEKGFFQKTKEYVTSALKKGGRFMKKHWGKILIALAVILLFIFFPKIRSAYATASLTGSLFADGNSDISTTDSDVTHKVVGNPGGDDTSVKLSDKGTVSIDGPGRDGISPVEGNGEGGVKVDKVGTTSSGDVVVDVTGPGGETKELVDVEVDDGDSVGGALGADGPTGAENKTFDPSGDDCHIYLDDKDYGDVDWSKPLAAKEVTWGSDHGLSHADGKPEYQILGYHDKSGKYHKVDWSWLDESSINEDLIADLKAFHAKPTVDYTKAFKHDAANTCVDSDGAIVPKIDEGAEDSSDYSVYVIVNYGDGWKIDSGWESAEDAKDRLGEGEIPRTENCTVKRVSRRSLSKYGLDAANDGDWMKGLPNRDEATVTEADGDDSESTEDKDFPKPCDELYNLKTVKAAHNYIYKVVGPETKGIFRDDDWHNIHKVLHILSDKLGMNVNWGIRNDNYYSGGYSPDGKSKVYQFDAKYKNALGRNVTINGQVIASAAGTVEYPMSAYDISFILF